MKLPNGIKKIAEKFTKENEIPKDEQTIDEYFLYHNAMILAGGAVITIITNFFWFGMAMMGYRDDLLNVISMSGIAVMILSSIYVLILPLREKKVTDRIEILDLERRTTLVFYSALMLAMCFMCISSNMNAVNNGIFIPNTGIPLTSFFLVIPAVGPMCSKRDSFMLLLVAIFTLFLPTLMPGALVYALPQHSVLRFCMLIAYIFFREKIKDSYQTERTIMEQQIKLSRANVITGLFLNTFDSVYYVNIQKDSFHIYRCNSYIREMFSKHKKFSSALEEYIEKDVYPDDRRMMYHAVKYSNLRKKLAIAPVYVIQFRDTSTGSVRYHEIQFVRDNDPQHGDHIAVSVVDRNEFVRSQREKQIQLENALKAANSDPMTNVRSRTAFEAETAKYDKKILIHSQEPFAVILCDVNNLKTTNDVMGHDAGDRLIIHSCEAMCEVFSHSPVFRIGGDEFVILLSGTDYDNRAAALKMLDEKQNLHVEDITISFAVGLSEYCPETDHCFQDVFNRADGEMYRNKRAMKEVLGLPSR